MNTTNRAKRALWNQSGLAHHGDGYLNDAKLNLLSGATPEMIMPDYLDGSGHEWLSKMRAIHSSAALVANTFGYWRNNPRTVKLIGFSGFQSLKFEAKCPTGLGGTPPHLDVLLESADVVIGIESKLLEPLTPTRPKFSKSYSRDRLPFCEDHWWNLLQKVRRVPSANFDSAQLIKHYLGLRNQFHDVKKVMLLYLFWKPLNPADLGEYSQHQKEIEEFQSAISRENAVKFVSMDYPQLWESWSKDAVLLEHANLLKQRYCVEI